tara:strand:+ start:1257 stop:1829 length:573 start_codon:yes stop_codon:yes gene_type:complete
VTDRSDPRLTGEERAHIVGLLEQTRDDLLRVVEPLTEAQWSFRPAPDAWSIGLIVEHLGRVEASLFGQVERALGEAASDDWADRVGAKDTLIVESLQDRSERRNAPGRAVPTGDVPRADAMHVFGQCRARSLEFAATTEAPLRAHHLEHHRPMYGALDAYQWLLYIPLHHQRHLSQIAEITAAPDFPAGG